MSALPLPNGKPQFIDQNGAPLALGSVTFYIPNTTTPKDTWQDEGQTILNTNPIALDAGGYAVIWGSGAYRQIVKDAAGNTIWDQITAVADSGASPEVFAIYATLRAFGDPIPPPAALVLGRTVAGDGGGGEFVYDSTDHSTADNGATVLVDLLGRRWKRQWEGAVSDAWWGATGNGATDDTTALQNMLDFCFGPASAPHGANASLNYPIDWGAGVYKITRPLKFTSVRGARVIGAGRFSTQIINTAGGDCWDLDGVQYSYFQGFRLTSSGITATVLNVDWTGSGLSTQSNSYYDMFVDGGDKGIVIGLSGLQASEQSFFDCFVGPCHTYGITVNNFNALGNNVYGGNIQSCPTGMRAFSGTINFYGTGFQGSTVFDIQFDSSANDAVEINGVRTESPNFLFVQNGMTAHVTACSQLATTNGWFVKIDGTATIEGCTSTHGNVGFAAKGSAKDCTFGRSDAIGPFQSNVYFFRVERCYLNGVLTIDRSYTDLGGGAVAPFGGTIAPMQNSFAAVVAAGGTTRIPLIPNIRVDSVWLDVDTAGAAGTLNVGDDSSATLYFNAQALNVAGSTRSTGPRKRYTATAQLIMTSTASSGLDATVNVDYTLLN